LIKREKGIEWAVGEAGGLPIDLANGPYNEI